MKDYKEIDSILDSSSIFNNYFTIKWRLLETCNYKCSYCIRNVRNDRRNEEHLSTEEYCEIAKDIALFVNKINNFDKIKIELIGGEPSLLDLNSILISLFNNTDRVKAIHMTTNFFNTFDYYKDLYELTENNNCKFSITASFHEEYENINNYFDKILLVRDFIKNMSGNINCEIVHRENNDNIVREFKEMCISNNLEYKIEEDLINGKDYNTRTSNMIKSEKYYYYDKENNKLYWSKEKKDGYKICNGRYLIIYDDGETESVNTRNELFAIQNTNALTGTRGLLIDKTYYCTAGYNFIDLVKDKVVFCRYREKIDIKDFNPINLENTLCTICSTGNNGICTFCGSLSLSNNYSFFEYREEEN